MAGLIKSLNNIITDAILSGFTVLGKSHMHTVLERKWTCYYLTDHIYMYSIQYKLLYAFLYKVQTLSAAEMEHSLRLYIIIV